MSLDSDSEQQMWPRKAGELGGVDFALGPGGFFVRPFEEQDRRAHIDFVPYSGAKPRRVLTMNVPQRFNGSGFSVSADGRWLLYALFDDFQDDIMQFENFR